MALFHPFFQHTLRLTTACDLRCFYCPLWSTKQTKDKITAVKIKTLIRNKTFFTRYPRKKHYHIIGGEPLSHPELLALCRYLKSENIKVHLWTHGQFDCEVYEQLCPYVHRFFIYFPSSTQKDYCEFAGTDGFENLKILIDFLVEKKKEVVLSHHSKPDTLQELPEIYELAYNAHVPLLIHYNHYNQFSKESRQFLKRFREIRHCYLYKTHLREVSPACLSCPVSVLDSIPQYLIVLYYKILNGIRFKIGL